MDQFRIRLFQCQFAGDDILGAAGDHQRLRHSPQRRKSKTVAAPCHPARGEVDFDAVSRNDRLLVRRNFRSELFAQFPYEPGDFNA
jgi:hypothetical protein